jgi:hypothetical protein
MTQLYGIKGSWNPEGNMEFNKYDTWSGKILLESDGWFEGIVRDFDDSNDSFVFGVHIPHRGIELHKISSSTTDKPLLFHGLLKTSEDILISDEKYEGSFEEDNRFERKFLGSSMIESEEIFDMTFLCEAKDLEKGIKRFKDAVPHDILENYRKIVDKRTKACEMLSRYFDGEPYDKYLTEMNGQSFGDELVGFFEDANVRKITLEELYKEKR